MKKIWKWCRNSATIVVARILSFAGVILTALMQIGADPNLTALVQGLLTPERAAIALAVIGLVVELARRRTAEKVQQ